MGLDCTSQDYDLYGLAFRVLGLVFWVLRLEFRD